MKEKIKKKQEKSKKKKKQGETKKVQYKMYERMFLLERFDDARR